MTSPVIIPRNYTTSESTNGFLAKSTPFFGAAAFCTIKIGDFKDNLKNENDLKMNTMLNIKYFVTSLLGNALTTAPLEPFFL